MGEPALRGFFATVLWLVALVSVAHAQLELVPYADPNYDGSVEWRRDGVPLPQSEVVDDNTTWEVTPRACTGWLDTGCVDTVSDPRSLCYFCRDHTGSLDQVYDYDRRSKH